MVWKVTGLLVIPKNITKGLNRPRLVRKAAFHSSPGLMRTLLKPQWTSSLVKYLALQSWNTSLEISGRGYLFLTVMELSAQLSASKVRWPELSQLSLCLEFDKENSMEFSLISLLLIHFTTMAMSLLFYGPHVTLVMWHTVTVTCDVTICHIIVTLWQSHMILSHAPSCSYKSNKKRKEKKYK